MWDCAQPMKLLWHEMMDIRHYLGYLDYHTEKATAKEALDFFGEQRTDFTKSSKFQGVETPSQSRYVGYYEVRVRVRVRVCVCVCVCCACVRNIGMNCGKKRSIS